MPRFTTALRIPIFLALLFPLVLAQAPVNDIISWPSGLLLLASILYAALGNAPDRLWEIEPTIGPYLFSGLPKFSVPIMQRVNWVANACHFVSRIRTAHGKSNFWIRSEEVTTQAKNQALSKVLSVLSPALLAPSQIPIDESSWRVTSVGLVDCSSIIPMSPQIKPQCPNPSTREFLLFAAIDYHVFREWEVQILDGDELMFSTKGMPPSSIVDVENEQQALYVVAAQLVRRPHSQSALRGLADHVEGEPWILNLKKVNRNTPICYVDFHSYAPEPSKVSASLNELARAYYRVVQYIKRTYDLITPANHVLEVNVGQTLWISILGGSVLDEGRLTIQNLPGNWGAKGLSADEAFLTRVDAVLDAVAPYANTSSFFDIVFSGGLSRHATKPFLIAGLFGQAIVCYFLSVGTSAGVWTSVALANALYAGRLTDWHSVYYGKTVESEEPGMKMYVPNTKNLMVIATFDRSTPKQGALRPGFFLNVVGLAAAIFGAVFQEPTRRSLGFGAFTPTPHWVIYSSVVLCLGTSLLITTTLVVQQAAEKTWSNDSETPTRWMTYSTIFSSTLISALAVWLTLAGRTELWPVLDALTWVSGFPLGLLENGRMFAADDNMLHLILLNRWTMGAVASSVGSAT